MKKYFKQISIASSIAVIMLLALFMPGTVKAATAQSGSCGTNTTWELSETGVLTISGTGKMGPVANGFDWYDSRQDILEIVIEEGVTSIYSSAFNGCSNMTKVTIPETVTEIGTGAFSYCSSLKEFEIPSGITTIPQQMVYECSALKELVIPENVKCIGTGAFGHCTSLTKIDILGNVEFIENYAFLSCSNLEEINFYGTMPEFQEEAFYNVSVIVYYRPYDSTWQMSKIENYGGRPMWGKKAELSPCYEGHTFTEWYVTTPSTCNTTGDRYRECTVCDYEEEETISKLAHEYLTIETDTEFTCTCKLCGDSYVEYTRAGAIKLMQKKVRDRETYIYIRYRDTVPGGYQAALDLKKEAIGHNGVPYLGDYLTNHMYFSVSSYGQKVSDKGSYYVNEVSYELKYSTTKQEEMLVDLAVLDATNIIYEAGDDPYKKAKAVYDYLCNHITYTYGYHDAYDAFVRKECVCQGYALATYRLMLEVGLDCRIVTGYAYNGVEYGPHAWNIVKIGDVYYNIDTTWGDNYGIINYDYFLKSEEEFAVDHFRDSGYKTESFNTQYPMAQESFIGGDLNDNVTWHLNPDGMLIIEGEGNMYYRGAREPWYDYKDKITDVYISEGIVEVASEAFRSFTNLTSAYIASTVTEIGYGAFEDCENLDTIYFAGNAPSFGFWAFENVTATCYYPKGDLTWNDVIFQDHGGNLNWVNGCDHEWISQVVPSTCVEKGFTRYSCEQCGSSYKGDYKELAAHKFGEWAVTDKPTCIAYGWKEKKCKVCGEITMNRIEKVAHKYAATYTTDKEATCTEAGIKSKHCTTEGCTQRTSATSIPKKAHTYNTTVVKATLTKNGKRTSTCKFCGYVSPYARIIYSPYIMDLTKTKYTYDGKIKKPSVIVDDLEGCSLIEGTDYTVTYASGRKNTGKYAVTIKFKGNYSGEKKLYFYILPSKTSKITPTSRTTTLKAAWKQVTGATGYRVQLLSSAGKVLKTRHTTNLKHTFTGLSKATTYKVKVTAYKTIGGTKYYALSSTTIKTTTAPAKPVLSVTAGSKKAILSWKKVTGTGYEIVYDTNSSFRSPDGKITVTRSSTVKKTISNLKKGKTYYFKIRAYRMVDGVKVYGSYSDAVKIKVK